MTALSEPPVGNGRRFAARPLDGGGTPTDTWLDGMGCLPLLDLAACRELVVVGAHPDDETLGLGATSALLAGRGVPVQVVSASDGGGSHPGLTARQRRDLEGLRRGELIRAAEVLGVLPPVSLGLPDGAIAHHERHLTELLIEILDGRPTGTWCAATWRGDGHPDHEAVGRAAAAAANATATPLLEYPVWMWHWAVPGDPAIPWDRASATPRDATSTALKHTAAQCFQTQLRQRGPGQGPVLPPFVMHRLLTVGEVVFR